MAGPKDNLKKGCEQLREKLIIERPGFIPEGTVVLGNGHKVTTVTYDMEQFLRSCIDRYLEVAGNVELKKVPTPGPHEETKRGLRYRPGRRTSAIGVETETPSCQAGGTSEGAHPEPVRGQLAPHAASVLMKILFCAKIARFDLLRQVNRLARNITGWTTDDDKKLHRLMRYIHHTKQWRMIGWVGDSVEDMYLAVYADADFSGCADSLRSTSGGHMNLQSPNTRFPLSGSSKRQGCVSHSTPEAEIVAADVAMRAMGMPALRLMERILGKGPKFVFFGDNKAMISVVRSGKNPTMRHLERSHGVAVTWMHDGL